MKTNTQKRSKKLYILLAVVLAVITVAAISVAFMLNYNTYAPQAPVVLDDGQNIYISTTLNDNYKGYRFKFVDENGNEIIVETENNQVSVQELLKKDIKLGKKYDVSVCYLAENVGNNSEYSKSTEWKCQTYLEMPVIEYDSILSLLTWQKIDGADYYRIYLSGEDNYFEVEDNMYHLKGFETGDRIVNVVAFSENSNYITSNKSNTLQIKIIKYFSNFASIEFDEETKIITAKASEEYDKIKIYLDETSYESTLFKVVKDGDTYTYTIDITTIYNGETKIGIAPCTINEYNIYNGEPLYIQPTEEI